MKKVIFTALATILTLSNSFAQDVITKKTSEDIPAKVIEVTTTEVKYKKYDNQNGPTFTLLKTEVLMIRYQDGTKDVFTEAQNNKSSNDLANEMAMKGKQDALNHYKGRNSGAGWTAASTVVLSPILGIIPAVACSSSEPSNANLAYIDPELMKNYAYNKAYTEQAHKTKKRKIWTHYGIGSGAWLLLVLLL
jgi:hypothetical protein